MATGGIQNLNYKMLKTLQGRKLIVFPDQGAGKKWKEKLDKLKQQLNIRYTLKELKALCDGEDIADLIIRHAQSKKNRQPTNQPLSTKEKVSSIHKIFEGTIVEPPDKFVASSTEIGLNIPEREEVQTQSNQKMYPVGKQLCRARSCFNEGSAQYMTLQHDKKLKKKILNPVKNVFYCSKHIKYKGKIS